MRTLLSLFLALAFGCANAQVNWENNYVEGYYKKDGTYVQGHHRTNPNSTVRDNYSTYPNVNPWTGQQGTKYRNDAPSYEYQQPSYQVPLYQEPTYQAPAYQAPTQLYNYQLADPAPAQPTYYLGADGYYYPTPQ